jgi:gas vesicle protein
MLRNLSSLLIGGLIGAGIAMALAPGTGAETREKLRQRAIDLKDEYLDRYGEVIEQGRIRATELVQSGRDALEEQLAKGQEVVNSAVETARSSLDQLAPTAETADQPDAATPERPEKTEQKT